ncbi:unnamed protein product [Macrosiphum euphorbiae]|uniref:Uncharacterized protein n=1 Tax=Macrosiphum euphorbiae TaxID=13131 RepID=A0AAV0XZA7_9HEMI|nr:unnamed protein product [Macrosiphum euphorbiae]
MVPWIVPICQIKLKNIIKVVQSTGLTAVSTICDQSPTNVNAINKLYKETNEKYNKEDKENRAFGFEIETQNTFISFESSSLSSLVYHDGKVEGRKEILGTKDKIE